MKLTAGLAAALGRALPAAWTSMSDGNVCDVMYDLQAVVD